MPTKHITPALGSAGGYQVELSFTETQIAKLSDLLDPLSTVDIARPMNEAAAAIGQVQHILVVAPTPAEQRAALSEAASLADRLLTILREDPKNLHPESRQMLLDEYAGGPFDDPDDPKKKRPPEGPVLFVAEMPLEAIAARSAEALTKFKGDIAAVARLHENLTTAGKRVEVGRGQPKKYLQTFAKNTLGKVYDDRFGGAPAKLRRQFVQAAIHMLKLPDI